MRTRLFALVIAAVAASGCGSSPSRPYAAPIRIAYAIPYEPGAANEAVQSECDYPTYLPKRIEEIAAKHGIVVELSRERLDQVTQGPVLLMRTTEVYVLGGRRYTGGGKKARVRGELREDGQATGDFDIQRTSGGKWTACGTLDHIADAIAGNIVAWLKAPQHGTRIGLDR